MRRLLLGWVDLWDRREAPLSLALCRVLLGLVVVFDIGLMAPLDLVQVMFGTAEFGGLARLEDYRKVPELYELVEPSEGLATAFFGVLLGSAVLFTVGLATRLSGLVLLLAWAQWALLLPWADRGIDMLMRNAVLLLVLSGSGRALSLDARLRTGSWLGDGRSVTAWPRYLLVVQLVIVYFAAGVSKVASSWLPVGDWSALYIAMRDPAFRKLEVETLHLVYPLTQLGTAVSWAWEWTSPLLLLAFWYRCTRTRGGRLRAWMNRTSFVRLFLLVGATFHVGTHFALQLGIFPFAMLALYPAFFHPDEVRRAARRVPWGRRSAA